MKKHKQKETKKPKKPKKQGNAPYPHNPDYCMIYPDADHPDDGIVSAGKS